MLVPGLQTRIPQPKLLFRSGGFNSHLVVGGSDGAIGEGVGGARAGEAGEGEAGEGDGGGDGVTRVLARRCRPLLGRWREFGPGGAFCFEEGGDG